MFCSFSLSVTTEDRKEPQSALPLCDATLKDEHLGSTLLQAAAAA
jgi:hypothetical protein